MTLEEVLEIKSKIDRGELRTFPPEIWRTDEGVLNSAIAAMREILGTDPTDEELYSLTVEDFYKVGWQKLLNRKFGGCPARVVLCVEPKRLREFYKFDCIPVTIFECKKHLAAAVTIAIKDICPDLTETQFYASTKADFKKKRWGILLTHFENSVPNIFCHEYPWLDPYKFLENVSWISRDKGRVQLVSNKAMSEVGFADVEDFEKENWHHFLNGVYRGSVKKLFSNCGEL